jgi:hypothetical protein
MSFLGVAMPMTRLIAIGNRWWRILFAIRQRDHFARGQRLAGLWGGA